MEKIYKLKHLPTGLFYQPVTGRWSKQKTNLSKNGKLYSAKNYPNMNKNYSVNISKALEKKLNVLTRVSFGGELMVDTKPEDWKVITYNLIETNESN